MSVPAILKTTLASIPATVPYLHPPEQLVEQRRATLQTVSGYRIGVCWQGNQRVKHLRDRSFSPALLVALAQFPGVTLVNLQHGVEPTPELPVATLPGLGPREMAFEDVAAVMKHLDMVITCDTSIAHLAGALGVPVWVALKYAACWRWMLGRDDSPWYPTMRLFRQTKAGDWAEVFERIATALGEKPAIRPSANLASAS